MRKPKNYKVATTTLDKEVILIDTDTDTDEVGGRFLPLCGDVNASCGPINTLAEDGEKNKASMQIFCVGDCHSSLDYDMEYKMYLSSCSENHLCVFEDNVSDASPMRLMFNSDNESSGRRKDRAVKVEKRRVGRKSKSPTSSVSKRLKTENVRVDRKSTSVRNEKSRVGRKSKSPSISSFSKKLNTKNRRAAGKSISVQKEKSMVGRKSEPPSVSSVSKRLKTENGGADHKSISRTVFRAKETQQKKGDALQGMKKACKKENTEIIARRNAKSQTIFTASKRVKTENDIADHNSIPVANTKDTQQKRGEAPHGRKNHVTKNKVESKSAIHDKDNILHSFKASKENEERLSSIDKRYAYYLSYLRNSITIFKPDQQVNHVKDLECLFDPDIIAVSDHPFSDGGNITFEINKDDKVIDLEDGTEPDGIFNSLFSKNLMEILRKPYDEKECLKLYYKVKLKRPLTRSRQLRDGREIEYNVDNQFVNSYLEQYKDFEKKFRRHRKNSPRALNLLRGFFFYIENIVHTGAFKPWAYEKQLEDMCFDARGCKDVEYIK